MLEETQLSRQAACAGNVQQQAACIGGLQALAYCPAAGLALSEAIEDSGCLPTLVSTLLAGVLPVRCLAAGALCNLLLGNAPIMVRPCPGRQTNIEGLHTSLIEPATLPFNCTREALPASAAALLHALHVTLAGSRCRDRVQAHRASDWEEQVQHHGPAQQS